jgi:hypothetical protein
MTNHPNRSKKIQSEGSNPTPEAVRQAREDVQARLGIGVFEAQTLCAKNVFTNYRAWQQWETSADNKISHRRMHPAFWKLHNLTKDEIKKDPEK